MKEEIKIENEVNEELIEIETIKKEPKFAICQKAKNHIKAIILSFLGVVIIIVALLLFLVFTSKSEEVKYVEDLISEIGIVTVDREYAIDIAELEYNKLTDEEKKQVANYDVLIKARSDFEDLPKELTLANIEEYLAFDFSYMNESESQLIEHIWSFRVDLNTRIYPIQPGHFSNVKLTLAVSCPYGWDIYRSDPAYKEDDENTMYIDVVLPSDGNYSVMTRLSSILSRGSKIEPSYRIQSVTGTFTPQ